MQKVGKDITKECTFLFVVRLLMNFDVYREWWKVVVGWFYTFNHLLCVNNFFILSFILFFFFVSGEIVYILSSQYTSRLYD